MTNPNYDNKKLHLLIEWKVKLRMEIWGFLIYFVSKYLFKEFCFVFNPCRKIKRSGGHLDGTIFWNLCLIPTFSGLGKTIINLLSFLYLFYSLSL